MAVKSCPRRCETRVTRLCTGAIALAKHADDRGRPAWCRDIVQPTPSDHILPSLLGAVRSKWHSRCFGSFPFINALLGGCRPGFDKRQLDADALEAHLHIEHGVRFPEPGDRANQIVHAAKDEAGPGLFITFNHWTDLALEIWGYDCPIEGGIELMVVGKDAYSLNGMRNACLHRYYDEVSTWRNLWLALLASKARQPYRRLASSPLIAGDVGVIHAQSMVGAAMRQWRCWPTNAVPYLRDWDRATGRLPREIEADPQSALLLAYQMWLLRPRHILVLGPEKGSRDGTTARMVDRAYTLAGMQTSGTRVWVAGRHSSAPGFRSHASSGLAELRRKLTSV